MSEINENNTEGCKSTPQKTIKIRNPFDKKLVRRLHQPLSSPSMCKMYKTKSKGSFRWDIEEVCTLVPADINVCNSQYEASPDPILEKIAEEATDNFFSQQLVVPSPMETSKKLQPLLSKTSSESSSQEYTPIKKLSFLKNSSAQTTLTLPPILPPEIEKVLQPFCTFSQEDAIFDDCEITENGSIVQTLYLDHSDHYETEQSDDEMHLETRPSSSFEEHMPVEVSPDLSQNLVSKGMQRSFGTPLQSGQALKPLKNKILNVDDYDPYLSPIQFTAPMKKLEDSPSLSSATSLPMSLTKDKKKKNCNILESDVIATCLDCVKSQTENEIRKCFCNTTPNKSILRRSTSLKESPYNKNTKNFLSDKRSSSMSSLNRSRSVQKLDFSMDMSVDASTNNISQAESDSDTPDKKYVTWSEENTNKQYLEKFGSFHDKYGVQSSTRMNLNMLDGTPIKGKRRTNVTHEISKIRDSTALSPLNMSLDNSLDNFDIPLSMEEKKVDFNTFDLKLLTENVRHERSNATKVASEHTISFKRVDSGFNENTFYASSYYESAIKPSELTITSLEKTKNNSKTVLKEISNVNWMRVDSGFKDETSSDSTQYYANESSKRVGFHFSCVKFDDKENIPDEINGTIPAPNKNDTMSISDFFNDDLTFTCNYSSTPSKSKPRNINS